MVVYLVKLVHKKSGKVQYKRGITKWLYPLKRFDDPKYYIFDISLLDKYDYSHDNWAVARTHVNVFEQVLNGLWPPKSRDFNVEQHLGEEAGVLDDVGVTEFIYLKDDQTEDQLVKQFKDAKKFMWKVKI